MKCSTIGGRGGGKNPYTVQCTVHYTWTKIYRRSRGGENPPNIHILWIRTLCCGSKFWIHCIHKNEKSLRPHPKKNWICQKCQPVSPYHVSLRGVSLLCCVSQHWVWLRDVLISAESVMIFWNKNLKTPHESRVKFSVKGFLNFGFFHPFNISYIYSTSTSIFLPSFSNKWLCAVIVGTCRVWLCTVEYNAEFFILQLHPQKRNYLQCHFFTREPRRVRFMSSWSNVTQL